MTALGHVDFCGEQFPIETGGTVTIGRDADVVIDDDNPYLHRRFLSVSESGGIVWLENIGNRLSATMADDLGLVQSWLSPGSRVPVVFPDSVVYFTAGPTTYDFEIKLSDPPLAPTVGAGPSAAETTVGRISFTFDQMLLCLALAEQVLTRGPRARAQIPASSAAAARLGWTITKFNRKLDNVCEKLARTGVRGLTSDGGRPASDRRSRLVEYVVASRLITPADLVNLDAPPQPRPAARE